MKFLNFKSKTKKISSYRKIEIR